MNTSYGPPCPEGLQREQKGGGLRPRLALPFIGSRSLEQPPHFVSVTAYVEMSPSPIGSHTSGTLICDGGFAVSPPPGFRWRAMEKVSESMLHLGHFTSSHPCPQRELFS